MNTRTDLKDMPFGLPARTVDDIRRFLLGWPEIKKVQVFGSRAMGNFQHNSDIDLCLWGDDIDFELLKRIKDGFNNLPTPYKFDVVFYDHIDHKPFKVHIDTHGVDFDYRQET